MTRTRPTIGDVVEVHLHEGRGPNRPGQMVMHRGVVIGIEQQTIMLDRSVETKSLTTDVLHIRLGDERSEEIEQFCWDKEQLVHVSCM